MRKLSPPDAGQIAVGVLEGSLLGDVASVGGSGVVAFPEINKVVDADAAEEVVAVES